MAGWQKISRAAKYAGVSVDTLNAWPSLGLRFVRLPSCTRLFKEEWIDDFLMNFESKNQDDKNKMNQLVDEVMADL